MIELMFLRAWMLTGLILENKGMREKKGQESPRKGHNYDFLLIFKNPGHREWYIR